MFPGCSLNDAKCFLNDAKCSLQVIMQQKMAQMEEEARVAAADADHNMQASMAAAAAGDQTDADGIDDDLKT
jgi:hypothetical protein